MALTTCGKVDFAKSTARVAVCRGIIVDGYESEPSHKSSDMSIDLGVAISRLLALRCTLGSCSPSCRIFEVLMSQAGRMSRSLWQNWQQLATSFTKQAGLRV